MTKVVVGLGEVLWDVYSDQALFGGAPANFACHAASLGADARIASAVGKDDLGTRALRWLEDHSLSRDWVGVDPDHPTGSVQVSLDTNGTPQYRFAPNVAWDFLELNPRWMELAQSCDAVCFGTLAQRSPKSSRAILDFLDRTAPEALKVFDVNLRQEFYSAHVLEDSLQRANVVKLNHEELPIVSRLLGAESGSQIEQCQELIDRYGLLALALTRGDQGSAVYFEGQWDQQPAIDIQAIDTVGAGDAFSAVLIMGILSGKPLSEIHWKASEDRCLCLHPKRCCGTDSQKITFLGSYGFVEGSNTVSWLLSYSYSYSKEDLGLRDLQDVRRSSVTKQ